MHHAVSAWRWGWDKEPYSGAGFPAHGLGGMLTHALAGAGTKTPLAALGDDRGARVHETVSPGHDFSVAIRSVKKTRDTSHSARRRDAPSSSVLQGRDVREEEPLSAPSWHKRVQEKQEPQRPETERRELRAPTAQTGMRGRTEPGVLSSWCRIDPRGPPRPSAPDLEACSSPEALRAWTPFWHLPGRPNSAPGFWLPRPSAVAPRPPSAWGPPTAQLPDPRVGTTALKAGCGSLALLGSLALPPPHSRGLGPLSRARCYLGRGEGRRGNHAWAGGAGPTWLAGKAQSGEMPPAK